MPIVASPIDLATVATSSGNGTFNASAPVWAYGGALYNIAQHNTLPNDAIGIYKSVDGGVTWAIQDTVNEPPNSSTFANDFDPVTGIVYVFAGPRSDQGNVATRLYTFNCATDTWTLVSAGGPAGHYTSYIGRNASGAIVVAYGPVTGVNLTLASYIGGVWANVQNLSLLTSLDIESWNVFGCVDSAGRFHVFYHNTLTVLFYCATVTALGVFSNNAALPPFDSAGGSTVTAVVESGVNLLLAVSESNFTTLIYGTPLAAPVFAFGPVIDAVQPTTARIGLDNSVGLLYVIFADYLTQQIYYLAQTFDLTGLTGWSTQEIYNVATDPPADWGGLHSDPEDTFPVGSWGDGAGTVYINSNYFNSLLVPKGFTQFYIGSFSLSGTIPPVVNNPADSAMIAAQTLLQIALPKLTILDNTGAAKPCYPIGANKSCFKWV